MTQRKKKAYEYAARQLFEAAEHLHEAADTIDLEDIESKITESQLRAIEEALTKQAQTMQKKAKENAAKPEA